MERQILGVESRKCIEMTSSARYRWSPTRRSVTCQPLPHSPLEPAEWNLKAGQNAARTLPIPQRCKARGRMEQHRLTASLLCDALRWRSSEARDADWRGRQSHVVEARPETSQTSHFCFSPIVTNSYKRLAAASGFIDARPCYSPISRYVTR